VLKAVSKVCKLTESRVGESAASATAAEAQWDWYDEALVYSLKV